MPEEIHDSRTWSLPSCAHQQGNTTLQQPIGNSRAAEWKEIQGITANKKPDAECPQEDCKRVNGQWWGKRCYTLEQVSKIPTTLPMQQKVYVQIDTEQNQWTSATITKTPTATQPRSYTEETKYGAHYQRNKRFLWPAEETPPPH